MQNPMEENFPIMFILVVIQINLRSRKKWRSYPLNVKFVVTILNSGDASVTLIDKDTQKVLETFPVGKEPHHLIATPDEKSLIVANAVGNDLVFLDPVTGKIQQRVPRRLR